MKQVSAPLIEAIQKHINQRPISFHVPGHKNGALFPKNLFRDFKKILPYDLTELEGLDDLHDPKGPIQEAEQLAATYYGAGHTFFLVGGSTVGNLAMVYALCKPGDIVLVQRNAHKSVFHAMKLSGVKPIFVSPEYDKETGHPIGITKETFLEAIHSYPEAKALLLTYPNYYGVVLDSFELIKEAKKAGLFVLVDEAHGAHFHIADAFPPSSLVLGADVVVQSTHKMLPALTMGSYLHVHKQVDDNIISKIQSALSIFQSSSPSYLIMASLDGARAYAEMLDDLTLNEVLAGVSAFRRELATIKQIEVVSWKDTRYQYDPLKVTIKSTSPLTGYELQKLFESTGIYTELADEHHVLLILGLGCFQIKEVVEKIRATLLSYPIVNKKPCQIVQGTTVSTLEIQPEEIQKYDTIKVPLTKAVGKIAAEAIIPYPPGIPVVLPGELIKKEIVEQLMNLERAGARFQGHQQLNEGIYIVLGEPK